MEIGMLRMSVAMAMVEEEHENMITYGVLWN